MKPEKSHETAHEKCKSYIDFRRAGGMSAQAMQEVLVAADATRLAKTSYANAGIDACRDMAQEPETTQPVYA